MLYSLIICNTVAVLVLTALRKKSPCSFCKSYLSFHHLFLHFSLSPLCSWWYCALVCRSVTHQCWCQGAEETRCGRVSGWITPNWSHDFGTHTAGTSDIMWAVIWPRDEECSHFYDYYHICDNKPAVQRSLLCHTDLFIELKDGHFLPQWWQVCAALK